MKKVIVFLCLILIAITLVGCDSDAQGGENAAQYRKITAEQAYSMMREGGVTVVDVRTKREYDEGYIQNAILIPNESIGKETQTKLTDKSAVILVYCRSGRRSREAANKLIKLGYKNVYDFGGINDWHYGTVSPV